MGFVVVIVMLALVQFVYFGIAVGRARGRHGVAAPAVTGDEHFERFHRAHQNTLEQLVVFIPACIAAAIYAHEMAAVACGVVYLIGRSWYFRNYIAEPSTRGKGMMLTMLANVLLIAGAIVGATRQALLA